MCTMSPAPQANLEVERYIGSYLISQRVPPNIKTPPGNKRYSNHHVKPKNGPADSEKVRNFNKYCFPQREHHVATQGRYSMGSGQLPVGVDYGGANGHYGKPTGWAGMPLISMTHRRNKKVPSTTNTPHTPQKHQVHHQNGFSKGQETDENLPNDNNRSPLTRLAIHTQGAPLIQAGRYGSSNRCRNSFNREPTSRLYRGETAPRWEAAKEAKASSVAQNKDSASSNTDSLSVASDESSGNSENSLPRIIKPRKRRKKDRKPITGTTGGTSSAPTDQIVELPSLKTFLPLISTTNSRTEKNRTDPSTGNPQISSAEESEDLIDPLASADEFPFGNLLDDEDDNTSEVSSCAPATICQCRYCDPSGVIWDVDQRCYSPFLTPPSPTNPLALTTFETFNIRPYNKQVSAFNGDLGSILRRSWSTPEYYIADRPSSEDCVRDCRPLSPLGLQVSSEIVTSPNGHRDIEIKFYSSSAPPESSKGKLSVSDRDHNDRYLVAEE